MAVNSPSPATPPSSVPPAGRRGGFGGGAAAPWRPYLFADLRRMIPVWIVLVLAAVGVIVWFGTSGSRILSQLAYTSPSAWEVAQVYRADGMAGWRSCQERVSAMRKGEQRLTSADGILKDDPVLEKAKDDLIRARQFYPRFNDLPGMLADLEMWDGETGAAFAWRGEEAAVRNEWEEALAGFGIARDIGITTPLVIDGRIESFIRLERWDDATSAVTALEGREGMSSRFYRLAAELHRHDGDTELEEEALEKSTTLDPTDLDSVYALSTLLTNSGRLEEAYKLFSRTTGHVTNNGSLWHRQAILAEQLGRTDEAVHAYKKAIELEPNIYALHFGLAQLYLKEGKPSRAKPYLTRAFELNPKAFEKDREESATQ